MLLLCLIILRQTKLKLPLVKMKKKYHFLRIFLRNTIKQLKKKYITNLDLIIKKQ